MSQPVEAVRKIVLVGNPNVGKSVFFHALTGIYAVVSNFPGTTVSLARGRLGDAEVIDTPGIYSVGSDTDEELVARSVILGADVVVNVVDATRLERDLFLTCQLIDMGLPLVVVLNMADEVARSGLRINLPRLAANLGVDVIESVATQRKGLPELKQALERARAGRIETATRALRSAIEVEKGLGQPHALLALEDDFTTLQEAGLNSSGERAALFSTRRQRVREVVGACVEQGVAPSSRSLWVSDQMVHPWRGLVFLGFVLLAFYYVVGDFFAQTVVGFTEGSVMQEIYEPWIRSLVSRFVVLDSAVGQVLVGEFGVATMAVTYLFGLLLPLISGFYLFLAVLEDSGYLPRLAALTDGLMGRLGLNGRSTIPFVLGFGCVTAAILTTRVLGTRRERTIATALLSLAVPCSAQLAVITVLLTSLGGLWVLAYLAVMISVLVLAGAFLNRILPGTSSSLLIDLPSLRWPQVGNVARKMLMKTKHFMADAAPIFILGSLLVGVLNVSGALAVIQGTMAPFVEGWLHLPRETATAFLMGFIRRDFGAAGLLSLDMSPVQILVAVVTITLFVPCLASSIVLFKERGWKEASAVWVGVFVTAFFVGGVLGQILIR